MAESPGVAGKPETGESADAGVDVECPKGQISTTTKAAPDSGRQVPKLREARSNSLDAARSRDAKSHSIRRVSEGAPAHPSVVKFLAATKTDGSKMGLDSEVGDGGDGGEGVVGEHSNEQGLSDQRTAALTQAKPPKKDANLCTKKSARGARDVDLTAASMQESFSAPCPADLRRLKRMPPLPKFKLKKRGSDVEDPDWVSVQYRVRTALTVDDVEYVRANDEYNQAIYLEWKRNKARELREQAEKAKKEEQKLNERLERLEHESVQLNEAKFQAWLKNKKRQEKAEHQHQWDTFQAYSKSGAIKQAREVHQEGYFALRESCFKLNGAKLPKTFDDWNP